MNPLCSLQHLLQLVGLAAQRRSHPGHRYTCWAAGSGCSAWCLGWIWAQQPCGLLAACTYMSHSYSNLLPLSARALVASDHMVNVHKWWFHINEPHCVNITSHMQPELSHNVFYIQLCSPRKQLLIIVGTAPEMWEDPLRSSSRSSP